MKVPTALITCVGGVISQSQIDSLRQNPEKRSIKIVGTDMVTPCVGQIFSDKFYKVPSGNSLDYVKTLVDICVKENVNVVFPASHEEAMALMKENETFENIDVKIACSKSDVLETSFNKDKAYQKLKNSGLPYPEYKTIKSIGEFEEAAAMLGIDHKKVVMKPVLTRGGRGARILTKESTVKKLLYEKPGYLEANYNEMLRTLSSLKGSDFPELILMEYLPGTIYSVDFLAKDGKALIIVPKIRMVGNPSQTLVGRVKRDPIVEESIKNISSVFGFDYNINIEMKCNEQGIPLPFDFNPRIAASVAFCSAAGANLIYYAFKMALGEEIPEVTVKDGVMMLRYYEEVYIQDINSLKIQN